MYNYQSEVSQNKAVISLTQVLMVVIVVFATLVLPIQVIEVSKQPEPSPYSVEVVTRKQREEQLARERVAGASTLNSNTNQGPLEVILSNEINALLIAGGGLMVIGIGLLIFLLMSREQKDLLEHDLPALFD